MPRNVPMPIAPLASFAVYDNEFMLIETLTGEQRLDGPDEVTIYIKAFDQLRDASATDPDDIADYHKRHALYSRLTVVGDPARAVLARLAGEYRALV